jgi:hypothetical protein
MNLRTLPIDMPLNALYEERIFTVAALKANAASVPLVAPFVAPFEALTTDWKKIQDTEHGLIEAAANADAKVDIVDAVLKGEVIAISHAVLTETNNDRTAALYVHYFGTFRPMDLKRSIREGHIATLTAWVPSLVVSPVAALKAVGTSLQATLVDADAALKAKAAADQALTDFRVLGERKTFVDGVNALRKTTYGDLAEMPHAHPELHLPVAFADGFFLHGASAKVPTIVRLEQKIAVLQSKLSAVQSQKTALEAADAAAAKEIADADKNASAAALKAIEDEIAAATAKAAALKAKLAPGPAPAPTPPAHVPAPTPPAPTTPSPAAPTATTTTTPAHPPAPHTV